jgi:hypothetical protein
MAFRAVVFRVVRVTAASLFLMLLAAFVAVQFHDHSIRRRNERLLADFHSIRLNQTTWPEAQALMQRWGTDGHAHGLCNATDCAYDITVIGWPSLFWNGNGIATRWLSRLGRFPLLLEFVGMRFSIMELRILVEDGIVRRTRLALVAETQEGGYGSALLVTVRSRAALDGSDEAMHTVGADEELGVHPTFVVGPDGFCTGCENISLAYTPQISDEELMRLTSFNLSCFTRLLPCFHLSALAPALMREDATRPRDVPRNSVPCSTPGWALARDAGAIWLVDNLTTAQVLDPDPFPGQAASVIEEDQVRLLRIYKGPPSIPPQTIIRFHPYSGVEYEARAIAEHLTRGHRYILFPSEGGDWLKDGAQAWRCGVLEDTPANELSIEQGMALNDHLREPELTGAWPW